MWFKFRGKKNTRHRRAFLDSEETKQNKKKKIPHYLSKELQIFHELNQKFFSFM